MLRAMTSPAHRIQYTYADYLALEATSNVRHEFLDGQIYGMAGGTPEHAALAAAVIGLLFSQLRKGRCRAHDADLRVRVRETGLSTYPDVTIVCGPRELDPGDPDAVTNPAVIVEVLSRSTEGYDRGDKFEHYKRIPALSTYVLVSQDKREIEVWSRDVDGSWTQAIHRDGETAMLQAIAASLDVRELYEAATEGELTTARPPRTGLRDLSPRRERAARPRPPGRGPGGSALPGARGTAKLPVRSHPLRSGPGSRALGAGRCGRSLALGCARGRRGGARARMSRGRGAAKASLGEAFAWRRLKGRGACRRGFLAAGCTDPD